MIEYRNVTITPTGHGRCINKVRGITDCANVGCHCGGEVQIEVCNALPVYRKELRRHSIVVECRGRAERQQTLHRENVRRWRARNPENAREQTRLASIRYRERRKEDATA